MFKIIGFLDQVFVSSLTKLSTPFVVGITNSNSGNFWFTISSVFSNIFISLFTSPIRLPGKTNIIFFLPRSNFFLKIVTSLGLAI